MEQISTAVAQQHLRSILSFVNSSELAQPETFIHFTEGMIDDGSNVVSEQAAEFLWNWLRDFHVFVVMVVGPPWITL